jgi:outer membrane protein TolC
MRRVLVAVGIVAALACVSSASVAQEPSSIAPRQKVTLQQAVQRALARHPSAVVAAEDIRRAEALVRQARATSLPTLTGSAIYTRLDSDRTRGALLVAAANQESANLNLSVPLVVPQRWVQWSHAKDNLDVARASADDVRRSVALSTARAYLTVISQHRIVEVNLRAVTVAKSHFDFAKAQFEGGLVPRIDQVRAEQEMATGENQFQLANVALIKSQEALGVLLGESGPVDATEEVTLPSMTPTLDTALHEVASLRTDVRAAQRRLRATDNLVKDSWTDFMPLLVGTFQPFYQNPPSLVNPSTGWQAQLILTMPFYDGGLRYGLRDERRALSNQSRAQVDSVLRQARSDVRASFESVRRADDALQAARRGANLAAEALSLANQAYQAGASTNLEVIDAERRARDAETSAVIAEDTARQARLDLLAASGRFP